MGLWGCWDGSNGLKGGGGGARGLKGTRGPGDLVSNLTIWQKEAIFVSTPQRDAMTPPPLGLSPSFPLRDFQDIFPLSFFPRRRRLPLNSYQREPSYTLTYRLRSFCIIQISKAWFSFPWVWRYGILHTFTFCFMCYYRWRLQVG